MGLQSCIISVWDALYISFPISFSHLSHICSSKTSFMHHDVELRVLTFSYPAAAWTFALLFNSCGMCTLECGAGGELSSWVGMQKVLHILSVSEKRNQEYVSWGSSHMICGAALMLQNEDTIEPSSVRVSALLAHLSILCIILSKIT